MKLIPTLGLAATSSLLAAPAIPAFYGDAPDAMHAWSVHDGRRPVPIVVQPGAQPGQPPADAIVLFDGRNLDQWLTIGKGGETSPAKWLVKDGYVEVVPKTGSIRTKQDFSDCQLHIEWATPEVVVGDSQGRGNSGVIFLGGRYEVQVLDSYNNRSYADGQAASVYTQNPPLVNVCRPPGVWQTYDIVFHPSRFDDKGKLVEAGTVTVFHNGVLVQDNWTYEGPTGHKNRPSFKESHPDKGPLTLQDHNNPMRFRNIWIRPIPARQKVTAESVVAQRAATAATIRSESEKAAGAVEKLTLQLESLVYQIDPATLRAAGVAANAYVAEVIKLDEAATKNRANEIKALRTAFKYLADQKITGDFSGQEKALTAHLKKFNLDKK